MHLPDASSAAIAAEKSNDFMMSFKESATMADIRIRKVPEETKELLRLRAKRRGKPKSTAPISANKPNTPRAVNTSARTTSCQSRLRGGVIF